MNSWSLRSGCSSITERYSHSTSDNSICLQPIRQRWFNILATNCWTGIDTLNLASFSKIDPVLSHLQTKFSRQKLQLVDVAININYTSSCFYWGAAINIFWNYFLGSCKKNLQKTQTDMLRVLQSELVVTTIILFSCSCKYCIFICLKY